MSDPYPYCDDTDPPWERIDETEWADEDGQDVSQECGAWDNGRRTQHCALAGTEECEFECPYR